ncbi:hypothetical protein [Clostridium felsineum]|uniref:Uncharacterized protein n=1 Tax=Clostridium felsineum TaxID=36839 RepID=A0A1S8M2C6_9CLOT|nr:hypothetical protein [Clostridium felsineum]URZ06797.1 hypothetical protein CLROS_021300 [Clostridium felsineum]URZ11829.1 hypothetical protein CROST_025460 [Clostridium felsineum]
MRTLIDKETGEIFEVEEDFDLERKKKYVEKKRTDELFKSAQNELCGNFIFFIYNNLETIEKEISDADLVKFMYLATYIKKGCYLMTDNNTYITKKMMQKVLMVTDSNFKRFYSNMINLKLITEDNKRFKVNMDIVYKGSERKYKELNGVKLYKYARIYIRATRTLYIQNYKRPKKLAIAFKLIKHVNWKYNILAKDVYTQDTQDLEALTIKDIMELLGYFSTNLSRFKEDFYGIKYMDTVLFKTVQSKADYKTSYIYINPRFAFRGNKLEDLERTMGIFKID